MNILREPVGDRTAWTGAELRTDPSWRRRLTPEERDDLEAELEVLRARGMGFEHVGRGDFTDRPAIQALADDITMAVKGGRGFVVISGFPVEGHTDDDIRMMYWRLGLEIGAPVSQDGQCTLIADVKERHIEVAPGTRHYGGKREAKLHVDLTDVVGLLCVRQAPSSPRSTIASATQLYNAILRDHPEWLPMLYEGFAWDRMGEQAPWEPPYTPWKVPVFSYAGGQLSSRYHRGWIRAGARRRGEPLSEAANAMIDYVDHTLETHALAFEMNPGDAYFANNYTVLHGRAAYEEEEAWRPADKRLLLRLWVSVRGIRAFADEAAMRFGPILHGNLGWTCEELAAGWHLEPGPHRSFGEPDKSEAGR